MPILEYRCKSCGAKFEKIVHSASAKTSCKQCGSAKVETLVSVFAVAGPSRASAPEPGPCPCGAPRRGMCGE